MTVQHSDFYKKLMKNSQSNNHYHICQENTSANPRPRRHLRARKVIACLVFVLLLAAVLAGLNHLLRHKFLEKDLSPVSTYGGYYEMEPDSVDVLFLGSSHSYSAFSPQRIYNKTGIRSYNLSSSEQSLVVSYYWLKEALNYQSPKAVVLDVFMCFPWNQSTPLNSAEPYVRKAIDSMRLGKNKIDLINTVCELDESYTKSSFFLTNLRYHERWEDLGENDFSDDMLEIVAQSRGYSASYKNRCDLDYTPFEAGTTSDLAGMQPEMEEYLQKIADLCDENHIQLILTRTPYYDASEEEYNTIRDFADENDLPYYDFNETSLYKTVDYNFARHNDSRKHVNVWGALKLSDYMGKILSDVYHVDGHADPQWEKTKAYYRNTYIDACLPETEDISDYLDTLIQSRNRKRYTIFINIRDLTETDLDPDVKNQLADLGLQMADLLTGEEKYYYFAVIDCGKVVNEQYSETPISASGTFDEKSRQYVQSGQENDVYNKYKIRVGTKKYGIYTNSINIIVYDNVRRKIIDHDHFPVSADRDSKEDTSD